VFQECWRKRWGLFWGTVPVLLKPNWSDYKAICSGKIRFRFIVQEVIFFRVNSLFSTPMQHNTTSVMSICTVVDGAASVHSWLFAPIFLIGRFESSMKIKFYFHWRFKFSVRWNRPHPSPSPHTQPTTYTVGIGQPAHPHKNLLSCETFFLVLCVVWRLISDFVKRQR